MKSDGMEFFRSCLCHATEGDFDGHTEFQALTPDERLYWLSQCARFNAELWRIRAETAAGCMEPDRI